MAPFMAFKISASGLMVQRLRMNIIQAILLTQKQQDS